MTAPTTTQATQATTNEELWRVLFATGEMRMMTIEGIDQAFEEGVIDARTQVLAPGAAAWSTLGEAAGLEDPALADTVVDSSGGNGIDPTPSLSPVALSTSTPSFVPPSSHAAPALDLDALDLDPEVLMARRKSKAPVILGIVGALAVAATIAMVAGKASDKVVDNAKASAAQQAPAAETPLPAADPAKDKPQLSEEQKKKLLDADKAREEKARAKNQEKAEKAEKTQKRNKAVKSGPVFVNGGNKFDPLNGAL